MGGDIDGIPSFSRRTLRSAWCDQSRQNKVSSCQLACILQSTIMCLLLHRFIRTELGDVVLEGRHGRDFVIVDDIFVVSLVVRLGSASLRESSTSRYMLYI
jgi:hypothetical protein